MTKHTVEENITSESTYKWKFVPESENSNFLEGLEKSVCEEFYSFYKLKEYHVFRNVNNHPEYGNSLFKTTVEATKDNPIYVFDFGRWAKLYMPKAPKEYRYRYLGEVPKAFVFGIKRLETWFKCEKKKFETSILIKDCSDHEGLKLASFFYPVPVVWEKTTETSLFDKILTKMDLLCNQVLVVNREGTPIKRSKLDLKASAPHS